MKQGATESPEKLIPGVSVPVNSDRVLVCGGRDYWNARQLGEVLTAINPKAMCHGGARGADTLAGRWADVHRRPLNVYHADWEHDGRAAGPIRNARMLKEFRPTLVVAFPGGRGTDDMVRQAERAGVQVLRIRDGVATSC